MALTAVGWQLSFTLIDTGNDLSTKTVELAGADYDEALANAVLYLADYAAASLAAITGYSVATVFAEDALTLPTSAGARNSIQAVITADIEGNPLKHGTIVVNAPVADVFVATSGSNSDVVNAAHAIVTNLVNNYKPANTAYISDGENIDNSAPNIRGYRRTVFRKLARL